MSKHHTERPPIVSTRVYSRAEVAEVLNVSLSTVKRLLASGTLRASQPPGLRRVFITGQAILDLLENHPADPATLAAQLTDRADDFD
ncbi:MAG: helix-turn-helix domain-containing protein [Chloroflexi bacterium]|nr:helix-turn-helix domain-containing protein [Chloroflexota bacterium]